MAVIRTDTSEIHPLIPDGAQACFECGEEIKKSSPDIIVREGYNGLVHGVNEWAMHRDPIYLHPACAAKLLTDLLADVRTARND